MLYIYFFISKLSSMVKSNHLYSMIRIIFTNYPPLSGDDATKKNNVQDHHRLGLQHQHGQAAGSHPRSEAAQRSLPPVERVQARPPGSLSHRAVRQDGGAGGPPGREHPQPLGQGADQPGMDLRPQRGNFCLN
jgi:hypothetical protein